MDDAALDALRRAFRLVLAVDAKDIDAYCLTLEETCSGPGAAADTIGALAQMTAEQLQETSPPGWQDRLVQVLAALIPAEV